MRIPLTRYGLREMLTATAVLGALAGVGAVLFWPAAILPAALWVYVVLFFRDPQRHPEDPQAFCAPADGKVVDVTPVGSEGPLGREGVRIGIFMNLLDVHVNRSPCAGEVTKIEHHGGGHVDARRPAAAERNEAATILLAVRRGGESFPVAVRQVAGLIARRIVTDLRVGQRLSAADRIGMVKFGSRVELMVPIEQVGRLAVRAGQTVRAGRTALVHPPQRQERP